ncbi:hypothetical protein L6164_014823 [Bauhinia variegata]|uniref:Uncharacterized protein n=1 Tax=Bauhinia variegata TaxID=167791 RepID=A0ACB9NK88_BAUVA|nr:hypothetical protein L6164_014823 [Bauhinia variegata]
MFGRIRALPSSPDDTELPPSKILNDASFSIYEATLMKLKLGAQRDINVTSKEVDKIINDAAITLPCDEVTNLEANSSAASTSSSQAIPIISPGDEMTMMIDTDCSSTSLSPSSASRFSMGNQEQPRHKNVSILNLFSKYKDSKLSQSGSASVSSNYSDSYCRSKTESFRSPPVREF